MAFRRRVAERISTVKQRAGLETPILEEITRRATIIESLDLRFPEVRGVIPAIAKGKAYGPRAGMWYRVSFPRPIYEPSVVCVGQARKGDIPRVTLPDIRVAAVEKIEAIRVIPPLERVGVIERITGIRIPVISIDVPRITLEVYTVDEFREAEKAMLGDWGPFNVIRDLVAEALARMHHWMWTTFGKGRIVNAVNKALGPIETSLNNIVGAINTKIREVNDRLEELRSKATDRIQEIGAGIDDRFETLRVGVNTRMETLRTRSNSSLESLRGNTEDSVQRALGQLFPRLYEAWGLRRDMALTALHVRSVTSTGFEFQSYGDTTAYWIAVGRRR